MPTKTKPRIYLTETTGCLIHVTYNWRRDEGFATETHEGNGVCVVIICGTPLIVRTISTRGNVLAETPAPDDETAHALARAACDLGHSEDS